MSKYDEVLKPFTSLMARELHANSGKGDRPGWLAMSAYDCMLEIYYHAAKLQKAIKDGNGDGIAEYSADVANMAMMVADICGAIQLAAATPASTEVLYLEHQLAQMTIRAEEAEALLTEARQWLGDGKYCDDLPREHWSPAYASLIDRIDAALTPTLGSTCNQIREETGLPIHGTCKACNNSACVDK